MPFLSSPPSPFTPRHPLCRPLGEALGLSGTSVLGVPPRVLRGPTACAGGPTVCAGGPTVCVGGPTACASLHFKGRRRLLLCDGGVCAGAREGGRTPVTVMPRLAHG